MRVLVVGSAGQLGLSLRDSLPAQHEWIGVDRPDIDITDRAQVRRIIGELRPQALINCAAYTAVDKAESEPIVANAVNADGAGHLAEAAAEVGARMVQVSTDFVFDGRKSSPYLPVDVAQPLSVYGNGKLAGERLVMDSSGGEALIVRTAWVYSVYGSNFVKTMLRLFAQREEVRVVVDQVSTPTHALGLARALWRSLEHPELKGIGHWTDAGVASWYDFAVAIHQLGWVARGGIPRKLVPISSAEYPTPAQRPLYSVLEKCMLYDTLGPAEHWQAELVTMLASLPPSTAP